MTLGVTLWYGSRGQNIFRSLVILMPCWHLLPFTRTVYLFSFPPLFALYFPLLRRKIWCSQNNNLCIPWHNPFFLFLNVYLVPESSFMSQDPLHWAFGLRRMLPGYMNSVCCSWKLWVWFLNMQNRKFSSDKDWTKRMKREKPKYIMYEYKFPMMNVTVMPVKSVPIKLIKKVLTKAPALKGVT